MLVHHLIFRRRSHRKKMLICQKVSIEIDKTHLRKLHLYIDMSTALCSFKSSMRQVAKAKCRTNECYSIIS